jgi:hypothetical protein
MDSSQIKNLLFFSLILGVILTSTTYFIDHEYKAKELKLSTLEYFKLYVNRFFHFIVFGTTSFYIFFMKYNIKYDISYLLFSIFIIVHWYLFGNGECTMSCYEKKILDNNYKCGDTKNDLFGDIIFNKITNSPYVPIYEKKISYIWQLNIYYVIFRILYYNFIFPNAKIFSNFIR